MKLKEKPAWPGKGRIVNLKASNITECPECGGKHLTWQTSLTNRSGVQQGRLNTRDVSCVFFLGCNQCSETLATVSADKIAELLNRTQAVAA